MAGIADIFGANVKRFRISRGLKQAGLADHVGLRVESVSRWEKGHHMPQGEVIDKIAEFLGVAAWRLFLPDEISKHVDRATNPLAKLDAALTDIRELVLQGIDRTEGSGVLKSPGVRPQTRKRTTRKGA